MSMTSDMAKLKSKSIEKKPHISMRTDRKEMRFPRDQYKNNL